MALGSLLLPAIRRLEPETAHRTTVRMLSLSGHLTATPKLNPGLETNVLGLSFPSPVGLAAGFDKDAEAVKGTFSLGLGFVEVGTITPRPQVGNPKPRLFRLTQDAAVINRMGFNNGGMDAAVQRLKTLRAGSPLPGVLGVNIGKNKTSEDAAADYAACAKTLSPYADYLTINVSSPNTPGLRALQSADSLKALVEAVKDASATHPRPILIKIAPDLEDADLQEVLAVAKDPSVAGLIVSNTTIARPESLTSPDKSEVGGLSGAPLRDRATAMLRRCYAETHGSVPLIGVGGIGSAEDAYRRIRAGASLIQLYTALVFKGPALIREINKGLIESLGADGFSSIAQAVGADHR